MLRFTLILMVSCWINTTSAQVTKIPLAAKENFTRQYPTATDAIWYNDIVEVNVRFELDGKKMSALYNNKGIWKNSLQDAEYDELPAAIIDGFNKSKYVERSVTETKIVFYPGNVTQYRIKAEKNDVEKKLLFFNEKGRLVRDAITL